MRRAYWKFRKFYAFSFDSSYFVHNRFLRLFTLDSQLFYALFQMFQAFFRLFTPFFIFWILSVNSQLVKNALLVEHTVLGIADIKLDILLHHLDAGRIID